MITFSVRNAEKQVSGSGTGEDLCKVLTDEFGVAVGEAIFLVGPLTYRLITQKLVSELFPENDLAITARLDSDPA